MNKRLKILWIIPLALGVLFDLLFWKQKPGINFAAFVVLCLVGGFFALKETGS